MTKEQAKERGIKVKPLVWPLWWYQDGGHREVSDNADNGQYHVSAEGWWTFLGPLQPTDGIDAAKAAAQADYEARILEALE